MRKKSLIFILVSVACVGGGYLVASELGKPAPAMQVQERNAIPDSDAGIRQNQAAQPQNVPETGSDQTGQQKPAPSGPVAYEKIQQNVPFLVQAPFGNWKDPVFQNACEEASMVMAMGWTSGISAISPEDGLNQIRKIVDFENATFGYDTDTDIHDMERIFKEYFHYKNITTRENISLADIKDELQKGNIVLVPAFGQALSNPNYTAPGPVVHMLVITGYDPATKEFITNDTGTKRGSGYRYGENVLFDAVWEYPSGPSIPKSPTGELKKGMLVVQPE